MLKSVRRRKRRRNSSGDDFEKRFVAMLRI
jgi:hypothetical protein